MTQRLRAYTVGHYRYPSMPRARLTSRQARWASTLPSAMLPCTITVLATTRADAYAQLRTNHQPHPRPRSRIAA